MEGRPSLLARWQGADRWPVPISRYTCWKNTRPNHRLGVERRRCQGLPWHRPSQDSSQLQSTASEIIADVLNEERRRASSGASPPSVLEYLDAQGWGISTAITRIFTTKFAGVTLETSWDDDTSGTGRTEARRMALLAAYQEWLVARSTLLGQLREAVERSRPGYLPSDVVERARSARATNALTPDTEALDGPALLHLAVLLLPPQALVGQLDVVLDRTRAEVLATPAYRGRDDLVPALDRGLDLLRASVVRSIAMCRFRASHTKEATLLQAELRRLKLAKQGQRSESSGIKGLWVREPAQPARSADASSKTVNDRLYGGQLQPESYAWMDDQAQLQAALAGAGRTGPRGLPGGRSGSASFRPLQGILMHGEPGSPGCSSFGLVDRLEFNSLDSAMGRLVARADHRVPAAAMSTFARLHRTALLDVLAAWQWDLVRGDERRAGRFYHPHCSHATAIRSHAPLQVTRRTRIEVAPGRELESLRDLAWRKGVEMLGVVHPMALKQVSAQGEWDYWRDAYRLWDRYVAMPRSCRAASLAITLTPEQVPDCEAPAPGDAAALEPLDMTSLTSMSSLDLDDMPLPAGVGVQGLTSTSGTSDSAASTSTSNASSSSSSSTSQGAPGGAAASGGGAGAPPGPAEVTEVQVKVPPRELQQLLLALLELLPRHVGEGASGSTLTEALSAYPGGDSLPSSSATPGGSGAAGAAGRGAAGGGGGGWGGGKDEDWLPAGATALQVRYSPLLGRAGSSGSDSAGAGAALAVAAAAAAGGAGGAGAAGSAPLPEELEASCYELRWAQGAATLTTTGSGGSTRSSGGGGSSGGGAGGGGAKAAGDESGAGGAVVAGARSAIAAPAGPGGVRWCSPIRLTQAQLLSLINIFTDVVQQVPELYDIEPPRLVVPTLSPLERLLSAARGAAASAAGIVGLLALLAVPLAAVVKAGHLTALGGGGAGPQQQGRGPWGHGGSGAAAAEALVVDSPHGAVRLAGQGGGQRLAQPSAECVAGVPGRAAAAGAAAVEELGAQDAPSAASSSSSGARAQGSGGGNSRGASEEALAEQVALCRSIEQQLAGRMWLEVTSTPAALLTAPPPAPDPTSTAPAPESDTDPAPTPRPQFQLVVTPGPPQQQHPPQQHKGPQKGKAQQPPAAATAAAALPAPLPSAVVLGCTPVNAAATALYPELPLAAALRGREAAKKLDGHLAKMTPERLAAGKAAPGRFKASYQTASYTPLPAGAAAAGASAPAGADAAGGTAPGGAASGAAQRVQVQVLRLELVPCSDPARRVIHGKGRRQREFAPAEVAVRPWHDSDSLLRWLEAGVQLPDLTAEAAAGRLAAALAAEDAARAAFAREYDRQTGRLVVDVEVDEAAGAAGGGDGGAAGEAHSGGAAAAGAPQAAKKLTQEQVQEALSLFMGKLGIKVGGRPGAGGSGADAAAPQA